MNKLIKDKINELKLVAEDHWLKPKLQLSYTNTNDGSIAGSTRFQDYKNISDDKKVVNDIDSKLELLNMMANKMGSSQNTNISSIEDFTKSLKDNAIDTINEKIEEKVNDVKETVIDVINETETPKINKDNP